MSLKISLNKIKKFTKEKYKDNLAAILIFGSANTDNFVEGKSDIDHMIFLKKQKNLNLQKEKELLIESLKSEKLATQYFHTLKSIKKYIQKRKSFSTYITIVAKDGAKTLYTTPEFEKTRKYLKDNPPTKSGIKRYLIRKDKFELYGYFKKTKRVWLTKALFSHLKRKIQILNYLKTGKFIYSYEKCLKNINLDKNKKNKLKKLHIIYNQRKSLSKEEIKYYYNLAEKFTKIISKN